MPEDDSRIFVLLSKLVRVYILVVAIAIVVLAVWGLIATAAAVDRGETWAQGVTGVLFAVAFLVMFQEIKNR